MIEPLRQIFRFRKPELNRNRASVPEGERYYVVGDVHGRLDLLEKLGKAIEQDDRQETDAKTTIVMLGDLVDRGPNSAGVVDYVMHWGRRRPVRCLAGNHEEMFLESFEDREMLRHFLRHGGRETILSYGLDRSEYNRLELDELQSRIDSLVPQEHRDFLRQFEEMIVAGDYLFVHAGIDPSRPLEEQRRSDLLWIRERFLRHAEPLSHVVVHGHTIFEDVEDRGNRIGIDTGAFRSGVLTALVLEGQERRYIRAIEQDGSVSIFNTDG